MAKTRNNFYSKGDYITVQHGTAFDGKQLGWLIQIDRILGVLVSKDPDNADRGVLATRGVFKMPVTGNVAIGARLYWSTSANNVASSSTSRTLCGVALEAAASSADTVLMFFDSATRID